MSKISFSPLMPSFGVEITGFEIANPIDADTCEILRQALNNYGVLLVRGQKNEPRHLRELASAFGPIDKHPSVQFAVPGAQDVVILSNGLDADGNPIGARDVGQFWHTDGSFMPSPHAYTVLQAIEIPERDGVSLGNTLFVSGVAAYDSLSDEMKAKIEGLRVVHSYMYRLQERLKVSTGPIGKRGEGSPDVIHPMVMTHPISGKKILYVNEGYSIGIVGMPDEEARALLSELFAHITRDDAVYRHSWKKNDVLIWDNSSTQHNAIKNYDNSDLRLMHRVMTKFPREWVPGEIVKPAA